MSGRFIRYVAAGVKRPNVKQYVDTLRRATERREGYELVQARLTTLDRLTKALDAVKGDGTPDHAIRIRAATVLRTRQDEADKGSEPVTETHAQFVTRITATMDKIARENLRLSEGVMGGRWANTHRDNGHADTHR